MRTIPYSYRIEGGKAVVYKEEAEKLHLLFKNYLAGMSLSKAATSAGIKATHSSIKRLLENRHYQGDDFYPAITDKETLDRIHEERIQRAKKWDDCTQAGSPKHRSLQRRRSPSLLLSRRPEAQSSGLNTCTV